MSLTGAASDAITAAAASRPIGRERGRSSSQPSYTEGERTPPAEGCKSRTLKPEGLTLVSTGADLEWMEKRFLLLRLSRRKTKMRGGLRVCNLWSSNGFLWNAKYLHLKRQKTQNPCYVLGVVYPVPLVCKIILNVSRFFALWLWAHIYYSLN